MSKSKRPLKKLPKCKKGYPCGRACINRGRNCTVALEGQGRNYADFLNRKNPGYRITGALERDFSTSALSGAVYVKRRNGVPLAVYLTRMQARPEPTGLANTGVPASDFAIGVAGTPDRTAVFSPARFSDIEDVAKSGLLRDGDVVVIPASRRVRVPGMTPLPPRPPTSDARLEDFSPSTPTLLGMYQYGVYEKGQIRPLNDAEVERGFTGLKARQARRRQSDVIPAEFDRVSDLATIYEREDRDARLADTLEDAWLGRRNTPMGQEGEYSYWESQSAQWRRKQGFEEGAAANGFTAEQTAAHDVAHPITQRMLGMNSCEIHAFLGGARDSNGRPSLLGEEAIVNVVEHLSRGDSIEASLVNGLRLARVLSRSGSEEERAVVRSLGFREALGELADRVYRSGNYRA